MNGKIKRIDILDNKTIIRTPIWIRLFIKKSSYPLLGFNFLLFSLIFFFNVQLTFSQNVYQPSYFAPNQTNNNYLANSSAFKQEIARLEINVVRDGKDPLPITQIPRLEKDDIIKMRLLEEQVNGMKLDQSNWNWALVVAYINPARNNEKEKSVSEEIQFKKTGWYKEYSFKVPYDCQPIFFLYTKPNYRSKILNLVNKNQEEIRKIGEKTLELSDAYSRIGSFLNELQSIINGGSYGLYGGMGNTYGTGSYFGSGNTYGSGSYYGSNSGSYFNSGETGSFNFNQFLTQSVERMARGFNIQLPTCWQNGGYGYGGYGGYSTYGGNGGYGSFNTQNSNYGLSQDMVGRMQCVAKSVRLEDFDISVSRLLQQGGMLAVAQLNQKYPQISFWINIAAVAIDLILKITKKSPLMIVPTVTSNNSDSSNVNYANQNNFAPSVNQANLGNQSSVKISLFAEAPPNDSGIVTAYPLVVNKWQANPDPEVINLPLPVLAERCLYPGLNIIKSTDLINDWMADNYTKDFQLVISSKNGFLKEFPLKKNAGLGGWELNLTREDLSSFPKINIALESYIVGKRGFNEIRSPKFDLPIPMGNNWTFDTESQNAFAIGGRRVATLRNEPGSCKCVQAVVYKPSFGGQFVFDVNSRENPLVLSEDGKAVSFQMDTTGFQPGEGEFELRQLGGETIKLKVNLYPASPQIDNVKIARGDNEVVIQGERLDQIQAVKINGMRGTAVEDAAKKPNPVNSGSDSYSARRQSIVDRTFVFEDRQQKLLSNSVSIELELENKRTYTYPKTFIASLARPTIVANESKEIAATPIDVGAAAKTKIKIDPEKRKSIITLDGQWVFPIKTPEVSIIVQNALTDYEMRAENIQIDTKIENGQISSTDLPKTDFEILDSNRMRITFLLNETTQRLLGGRRLQFRISDKERGNSDWYAIQQTFVRTPESISVKCTKAMNRQCELSGAGVEYISQVSVDGGQTWFPDSPATLSVQLKTDGRKVAMIPFLSKKTLLQIKLGDFPIRNSLSISDYTFSNLGGAESKN